MNRGNIILIGMPGVGKSTIGVLLAKALGRGFLDTDVRIQSRCGKRLQELIDLHGLEKFLDIEEHYLLEIDTDNTVIATGGSAVYSDRAMSRFSRLGTIVWLDVELDEIVRRVTNLSTRGVVMEPGETLESLYEKRRGLYEKWADIRVQCKTGDHQQTLSEIITALHG